ncbi:MAG TPA: hypothetical protein VHY48_08690 [Acidobacteriaceae bacterium]|nr:hypothetical protein [Acidobacteriaceae bacterium]
METRNSSAESVERITWPLIGSLLLTGFVVALVCVPPFAGLKTWGQVFWLACLYLLVAAAVHALAVWSIYRIQSEGVREWTRVWPVVWGAWIAVVWLPLVALLTYERSRWITAIVPLVAVFLTLFVMSRRRGEEDADDWLVAKHARPELFAVDESPPLWRVLLPVVVVAVAIDGGAALYVIGHAWLAGCLFAGAAAYLCERLLSRTAGREKVREGSVRRGAAGNSVAVWMMTVVALLPFLAGMGVAMRGWMGMAPVQAANHLGNYLRQATRGYVGVILTRPKMKHEIVTPVLTANLESFAKRNKMIPFDGQYWYFKQPANRPGPNPHVVQGDPTKTRIASTDSLPIVMEAHQRLRTPMEAHCCRALELNVVNADAVPGSITMEVQLRGEHGYVASLGDKVLASSLVSPMPLHRAPVHEMLVFQLPRGAKERAFDEITVKVKPERSRSLAAPEVAIQSFGFQR